jgi:hypothetical protein
MVIAGRSTRTDRSMPWALLLMVLAFLVASACVRQTAVVTVNNTLAAASASTLDAVVFCHDSLGRPEGQDRFVTPSRCTPCIPKSLQNSDGEVVLTHARKIWEQRARAPYDENDVSAACARIAYNMAGERLPGNDALTVEIALFGLADANDSVRLAAVLSVDALLARHHMTGQYQQVQRLASQFAFGVWDRAQRQLERPRDLSTDWRERQIHRLAELRPAFSYLPPLPGTSDEIGVSEAEWAARLFSQLAGAAATPAEQSRYTRLALSPWVVFRDWTALDSAARSLRQLSGNDSATWPAVALAAYRQIRQPVMESPRVMALFDSALRVMPRIDSARYDGFDAVLTQEDDDWRYGFLPDERERLDIRGWAVLDPLWSTPVNEIRLERRARIADADYRYADLAGPGQAGSETPAGDMLVRLGVPNDRWVLGERGRGGIMVLSRGWRSMQSAFGVVSDSSNWRMFYGPNFSIQRVAQSEPDRGPRYGPPRGSVRGALLTPQCTTPTRVFKTLYECALSRRAEFVGLPFYGTTDTIDVTVARFRAAGDSAEMYIGMRLPLRRFTARNELRARPTDSVVTGMWVTTSLGKPLAQSRRAYPLPAQNTVALYDQYRARVASSAMMHRVEAMEASRLTGARGAMQFTSEAHMQFPLHGFGMSDPLVAASLVLPSSGGRRWSDLVIEPNGGVIAPRQKFALAYEVYDLTTGPDGRVRWRVQIRRERGNVLVQNDMQKAMAGSLASGTKVAANEQDASDMTYVRDANAQPVILDYLAGFYFPDVPVGKHVLEVRITDLVSGRVVVRSTTVRVLPPESQRRIVR